MFRAGIKHLLHRHLPKALHHDKTTYQQRPFIWIMGYSVIGGISGSAPQVEPKGLQIISLALQYFTVLAECFKYENVAFSLKSAFSLTFIMSN